MRKYGIYLVILVVVCSLFYVKGYAERNDSFSYILRNKKDCGLCGEKKDGLKSIYGNSKGIGLMCLNDWRVVQIFAPADGHEQCGRISYQRGAGGSYSIQIEHVVESKISLVEYTSCKGDVLDRKKLAEILCWECLGKVKEAVKIHGEHGGQKEKAVCLVEFPTMELYTVQQIFQYYMLDNYYIQAQCEKEKIKMTAFMLSSELF